MNTKWLKWLNPLLFVVMLVQVGSGMWLKFAPNNIMYEVHENLGPVLVVLIVMHLILNFGWIKANFFKEK